MNENADVARELGRRIVADIAPEELPLFDETWKALGRKPQKRGRQREEPLGFGLLEAGTALVTAVVSGVVSAVLDDLGEDAGSRWAKLVGRLRRTPIEAETAPPALLPQRLKQIRQLAHDKARVLGLSDEQADALADSLVAALAMEAGGDDGR